MTDNKPPHKPRKRLIVCISPLAVIFIVAGVLIVALTLAALLTAALGSGD